ncbi:MAG: CpsB/CapC family capsule biosynthesis tyrosine phosphatase [Butyrivibrio sp.]
MEIADMHCHVIPAVDDGAADMNETRAMLDIAYKEGIRLMVVTPHYHIGKMKVSSDSLAAGVAQLKDICAQSYPGLKIYPGQEIYYYSDAVKDLNEKRASTIAGSRYVLLEYSTTVSFHELRDSVYEMVTEGYIPIIAHAERYGRLHEDIDLVRQLIDDGAYIQINAGSVIGKSGNTVKRFVKKLLKYHMVHFVATDAHDCKNRAPHIKVSVEYIRKKYGDEYAVELFLKNILTVIQDEYI